MEVHVVSFVRLVRTARARRRLRDGLLEGRSARWCSLGLHRQIAGPSKVYSLPRRSARDCRKASVLAV
jgi:hypothetical protein